MKLPQLTLRDLFWLVLVVGMGLGWTMHARRIQAYAQAKEDRLESLEKDCVTAMDERDEALRAIRNSGMQIVYRPRATLAPLDP